MKEIELKPCPFCGGEAEYTSEVRALPIIDDNGAYIDSDTYYFERTGCQTCDIWFEICEDDREESTIEAWNRRYEQDA